MDEAERIARRLGARIREARRSKGLTLDMLGSATNLSPAFLSRLERGEASTSIANLIRITGAIGTPLQDLFDKDAAEPLAKRYAISRRRAGSARPMLEASGYRYEPLGGDLSGQRLDAFELEFPPSQGEEILLVAHEGEEIVYILSGRIEFQIGADRFVMEAGDCVHFDCEQPHMGRNIGSEPARMLMVVSPSRALGARFGWWSAPTSGPKPPEAAGPEASTHERTMVKPRRRNREGGKT